MHYSHYCKSQKHAIYIYICLLLQYIIYACVHVFIHKLLFDCKPVHSCLWYLCHLARQPSKETCKQQWQSWEINCPKSFDGWTISRLLDGQARQRMKHEWICLKLHRLSHLPIPTDYCHFQCWNRSFYLGYTPFPDANSPSLSLQCHILIHLVPQRCVLRWAA